MPRWKVTADVLPAFTPTNGVPPSLTAAVPYPFAPEVCVSDPAPSVQFVPLLLVA